MEWRGAGRRRPRRLGGRGRAGAGHDEAKSERQAAEHAKESTIRRVMRLQSGGAPLWEIDIRERGGRITSLKYKGGELLDQGIGVDDPTADGFVTAGAFGWDEMVPTVESTETLPDHGEAWRLHWTTVFANRNASSMECKGRVLPWRLRRHIVMNRDEIQIFYELKNVGRRRSIPGYWSAHPLFRYERDMEIDIGAKLMGFAEGKSGKFFLPPASIDRARLRWRRRVSPEVEILGTTIELSWDPKATPYCGVWICNGDLGGYRQVAIEPATGGGDRPDSDEPPPTLEPGDSLNWWLKIRAL